MATTSAVAAPRRLPGFGVQVAIGMAAGLALGLAARAIGSDGETANGLPQALQTVGQIFVRLLKVLCRLWCSPRSLRRSRRCVT